MGTRRNTIKRTMSSTIHQREVGVELILRNFMILRIMNLYSKRRLSRKKVTRSERPTIGELTIITRRSRGFRNGRRRQVITVDLLTVHVDHDTIARINRKLKRRITRQVGRKVHRRTVVTSNHITSNNGERAGVRLRPTTIIVRGTRPVRSGKICVLPQRTLLQLSARIEFQYTLVVLIQDKAIQYDSIAVLQQKLRILCPSRRIPTSAIQSQSYVFPKTAV